MAMALTKPVMVNSSKDERRQGRGRKPRIDPAIGENVRTMRERNGWRQIDLADKAGVAEGTITGVESGRRTREENLRKIAVALGCTVEQLATGQLPDPLLRFRDLTEEDLRFAREFHNATTARRTEVIRMLRDGEFGLSDRIHDLDPHRKEAIVTALRIEERRQKEEHEYNRRQFEKNE